jgi:hypothetical protein
VPRGPSLFRGSELPRLLVLVAIMVAGWVVAWQFARKVQPAAKPPLVVEGNPRPVVPDRSIEFESVTDRTPMSLRDNAGYVSLIERARSKNPDELAREARRDVLLTHLWERPELYRGVPIVVEGTVRRSLRYQSKLSKTGWLYEAWMDVPDVRGIVYTCVFEEPPKGFPLGSDISEQVVFNGYFLKIMVYQAATVDKGAWAMINRGSPVLVGQIGWTPSSSGGNEVGSGSTLRWTLILLGVLIAISALRWIVQLRRFFGGGDRGRATAFAPDDRIDPETLKRWAEAEGAGEDGAPDGPDVDGESMETAGSGAQPSDEAQSTSSPATGD